jgi:hypothetical protein
MYAVVVDVSISDVEQAQDELRERVVPMVSHVPGFVSGVWMEYGEGKGHPVVVFEGEDAANAMAQQVRSASMSVTVDASACTRSLPTRRSSVGRRADTSRRPARPLLLAQRGGASSSVVRVSPADPRSQGRPHRP